MRRLRPSRPLAVAVVGLAVTGTIAAVPSASTAQPVSDSRCSAGAHTLGTRGDDVYPQVGNGGYRSVHTDIRLRYDAVHNLLLPGSNVALTDRATQCLSSFSLDFARHTIDKTIGPDLRVTSVTVDGQRAGFRFVQPTYPGDPHGQNDPNPLAHEAGQHAVVGGPKHDPLPPACTPQLPSGAKPDSRDGTQCPRNKLVVTPAHHLAAGRLFTVTVHYQGRPGVYRDGDSSTEGWFRSTRPKGDGGLVTTEPVGAQAWMPLNDVPSAKPTYDLIDTVTAGRTVIGNGRLVSRVEHGPGNGFPHGSVTYHWHESAPVANYLVQSTVGHYDELTRVVDGRRYRFFVASALSAKQRAANFAVIEQLPGVLKFESSMTGPYPFDTAGALVGTPSAGFEEEMESMITFAAGFSDVDTLYHEAMHQWWGDNVSESTFRMTFYKEGLATLAEYYYHARLAAQQHGGLDTVPGRRAFTRALHQIYAGNYASKSLFRGTPSDPSAASLFAPAATYARPGTSYLALRRILGPAAFKQTLVAIQHRYGGGTIDEAQLKSAFAQHLPNRSHACRVRLHDFFGQWWDTGYPHDGAQRPSITPSTFYSDKTDGSGC